MQALEVTIQLVGHLGHGQLYPFSLFKKVKFIVIASVEQRKAATVSRLIMIA